MSFAFKPEGVAPGLLPTTTTERSVSDTQKQMFMQEVYQKEAEVLGLQSGDMAEASLTPYQKSLLQKIRSIEAEPIRVVPNASRRSAEQIEASTSIHKRVNPGFVDLPYKSTNTEMFTYLPAPDFSKNFLKKDSDCGFQKYAAEAILKHVDLKKTSH
mmetsp:Transcript_75014/g.225488  ORF Transcript_75014/g.225488 Transcript_75014/m.225488 type:complete len:157 (-) Transcript_75014:380-850(-)